MVAWKQPTCFHVCGIMEMNETSNWFTSNLEDSNRMRHQPLGMTFDTWQTTSSVGCTGAISCGILPVNRTIYKVLEISGMVTGTAESALLINFFTALQTPCRIQQGKIIRQIINCISCLLYSVSLDFYTSIKKMAATSWLRSCCSSLPVLRSLFI